MRELITEDEDYPEIGAKFKQIQEAEARAKKLDDGIVNLEKEVNGKKAALKELRGGYGHVGVIKELQRDYRQLVSEYNDRDARKIHFINGAKHFSGELIVDKVTAKRIYMRVPGGLSTHFTSWDGKYSHGSNLVVDLERTFPEGIEKYFKNSKAVK